MCSNYISCEGISLNQAHIVRNDDLRVEPSSSLIVPQSILTQHHLNLIKDLEGELSLNFWSKIFAKRNQENLKMGSSTCLSLIARHFPLSMTWCRCFTTFQDLEDQAEKWNGRVQMKKRGYPYILPSDINWENRSTKLDQRSSCGVTNSHNTFPPMRGRISQIFIRSGAKK